MDGDYTILEEGWSNRTILEDGVVIFYSNGNNQMELTEEHFLELADKIREAK